MMIGIIANVISIIADNTYAALPNTCDKAEPSDLERSSGIVESVRRIAARTIERKATGEAAALVISPSEAREEMNIMTASTMKKALSFIYLAAGSFIANEMNSGIRARMKTDAGCDDDMTIEYERRAMSFAFGFIFTRKLSEGL